MITTSVSTRQLPLDEQRFEAFYRVHIALIYRYVSRKVGNRQEAEELTSSIFLKAVRLLQPEAGLDESPTKRIQGLLQALPQRERDVLCYRFLHGLSTRETAVRMGLTEGNVKTLQFRALKRAASLGDRIKYEVDR